jgi:sortase (surface protein transpeptidase)
MRYRYVVEQTVETTPERIDILEGYGHQQGIALVTCTPVYSAARRLVVLGALEQTAALPRP